MTPADLSRLSTLLDEALDLPLSEREAWLAALERAAAPLAPALRELLARHASKETAGLLDRGPAFTAPGDAGPAPGDAVGPYRLLSALGSGGMGAVWLAERADGSLKRKVALKLPHLSWAPGLAERFTREREILASLEHPNIARLYDAGLDAQGRPFMALEYVEGQPLDVYCRERAIAIPQRLRLLLQVAEAVAFAHGRLVLHRDLKPANILVTAEGQVRLLDFGVAKLMQGDSTAETALTQASGRALTLDYASPEQIRGAAIGTASDVYSLGVVAFELLAGVRPYRLKRGSAAELEEAITAQDLPLASAVAADLATAKALRGDLDSILNQALKKDAAARYGSIDALAQEWRRHLDGARVLARPDTLRQRVARVARRHRVASGAGAAVLSALIVGLGSALWQARAAARERDYALTLLSRNEGVVEFLDILITEAAQSQRPLSVAELLARSEALADREFRHAPERQALVLYILGTHQDRLGQYAQAQTLLMRAIDTASRSVDPSFKARLDCGHASSLGHLGHIDEARALLLAIVDRTDIDPGSAAACFGALSELAADSRDGPAAVDYARQALARLKRQAHASPTAEAKIMTNLASALALVGRTDEASEVFAQVLARYESLGRGASPTAVSVRNSWAVMHGNAGDPAAALALFDEILELIMQRGTGEPSALHFHNRGNMLHALGRFDNAIQDFRTAIAIAERAGDPNAARRSLFNLVDLALDTGKVDEAREMLGPLEGLDAGAFPAGGPDLRVLRYLRGRLALAEGRLPQARAEFTATLEGQRPVNFMVAMLSRRAEAAYEEGRLDEAHQDAEAALVLARKLQGGKSFSWRTGAALLIKGRILDRQGDAVGARQAYGAARQHLSNSVDPSHPALRQVQGLLADAK